MSKPMIFIVDLGYEYYKMGFSTKDCSIFDKTPVGIFDKDKRIQNIEKYCNLIADKLKYQIKDSGQTKKHSFNIIIAVNNDAELLSGIFKSTDLIKGILMVHPRVMDLYATGRKTGMVMNVTKDHIDCAVIADSRISQEFSKKINEEELIEKMKECFDNMYKDIKQDLKSAMLNNVVICGGIVDSNIIIQINEHIVEKAHLHTPKIIADHTFFSTYTGMDILSLNPELFILRKEWEEYDDRCVDKFGIEWYK